MAYVRIPRFLAAANTLKLLRADALHDPDRRARFVREGRAASAINHPNIVTVYDIDKTADGSDWIAMEYVEGLSLDRRLAEGPLPVAEALRYALELARALAGARYASADELLQVLLACQGRRSAEPMSRRARVALLLAGIAAIAGVTLLFGRAAGRSARERTARRETLPEIERLAQPSGRTPRSRSRSGPPRCSRGIRPSIASGVSCRCSWTSARRAGRGGSPELRPARDGPGPAHRRARRLPQPAGAVAEAALAALRDRSRSATTSSRAVTSRRGYKG